MDNLFERRDTLVAQRMRLDKFFTLFLDKFHAKMNPDNTDSAVWKLYKLKLKEYDDIQRELRSNDYWIKRSAHV